MISSKTNNPNYLPTQVTATFAKSKNIHCNEDRRSRVLSNSMFLGENSRVNILKERNLKTQEVFNDVSFDINSNFENKENAFFMKDGLEQNPILKNIKTINEDLDDLVIIS